MQKQIVCVLTATAVIMPLLGGCGATNQTKGAVIGAGAGTVLGGVIGHQSDHKKEGAIIGAVAGTVIGALIGKRMDNQAAELEKVQGVEAVKVNTEAGQEGIEAKMKVLFDVDKVDIKPAEALKLDDLAAVFAKYPENIVVIEGHTDSDGSNQYNQQLSERRAGAIEGYLRVKNLNIAKLSSVGYGESMPIAPNDTAMNKATNRRVEIKISVDPSRVPHSDQTSTGTGQPGGI